MKQLTQLELQINRELGFRTFYSFYTRNSKYTEETMEILLQNYAKSRRTYMISLRKFRDKESLILLNHKGNPLTDILNTIYKDYIVFYKLNDNSLAILELVQVVKIDKNLPVNIRSYIMDREV